VTAFNNGFIINWRLILALNFQQQRFESSMRRVTRGFAFDDRFNLCMPDFLSIGHRFLFSMSIDTIPSRPPYWSLRSRRGIHADGTVIGPARAKMTKKIQQVNQCTHLPCSAPVAVRIYDLIFIGKCVRRLIIRRLLKRVRFVLLTRWIVTNPPCGFDGGGDNQS